MSLSKSLQDIVECPVCLTVPRKGPFPQCVNGHILCVDCRDELHDCPICRDPFSTTRNLTAEKVLEFVPLPCKFEDHGCTVKLASEARFKHEKVCPLREVECPVRFCFETPSIAHLRGHVKESHSLKIGQDSYSLKMLDWVRDKMNPVQIDFNERMFFAVCDLDTENEIRHFWVYVVNTPKVALHFKFTLTFTDNKGSELKFTDTVSSMDIDREEVLKGQAVCTLTRPMFLKFSKVQIAISQKVQNWPF